MGKNKNLPKLLERAKDQINDGELKYFTKDMLSIRVEDVLNDSCFYLSAGADITPIVAFKDIIYSFILCDLDLSNSIEGIDNKFNGILVKVKDRLIQQGFLEIQKFNLGKDFLGIEDRPYSYQNVSKMINCEISFWSRENKIYSVMYINDDNTYIYKELFIKNYIIPKAICEYKPEGGGFYANTEFFKARTLTVEQKNNVMPDFYLGHKFLDSIGNADQYELITDNVKYFGDYGGEGLYLFKKMN